MYALGLEAIERRVESERLGAYMVLAQGGKADLPTLAEAQQEYDEWLCSPLEPEQGDTEIAEWRQAMGLGVA